MKAKQIHYERLKSENFNNQTIGIILDVEENESAEDTLRRAKDWVAKQFGEEIKKTYMLKASCKNCKETFGEYGRNVLEVNHGTLINQIACPNCGCFQLENI